MSIVRGVLAVVAGLIVASVVMMAVEYANGHVIYPDLGKAAEGVTDREVLRQLLASAPAGALLVVMAGWLLGSLAGGYLAARIGAPARMRHALITGVLLTVLGVLNNLMLPPPAWFWIGLVVFVPGAWLGGRAATRGGVSVDSAG